MSLVAFIYIFSSQYSSLCVVGNHRCGLFFFFDFKIKSSVVARVCNPSAWGAETGRFL